MLSGNNGVLQRATDAKTKSDEAQIKERIQLAYHSALTGGKGSYTKDSLMEELKNEFTTDYDVDDSDDENWKMKAQGQEVIIPAGKKENVKTAKFSDDLMAKTHSIPSFATITKFERLNNELDEQYKIESNIVSAGDSETEIYMWSENNILYWYSEASNPKLPPNCASLFGGYNSLLNASGLENFDTSEVTNMSNMFGGCYKLQNINLKNWNTCNVTNMSNMFNGCFELQSVDLTTWNTDKVENMSRMFWCCYGLVNLDLSSFNTKSVTNMSGMFGLAEERGSAGIPSNVEPHIKTIMVSNTFDISNVNNSANMFKECTTIIGGNGTTYDSTKVDKTYAHIDGGASNPGYFTAK